MLKYTICADGKILRKRQTVKIPRDVKKFGLTDSDEKILIASMMQVIEPNAIPSRIARGVYEARVLLDFSIDSIEEV